MSETDRVVDRNAAERTHGQQANYDTGDRARAVFKGLAPRATVCEIAPHTAIAGATTNADRARRARSAAFTTVPVVLTGAIALSLGLTGPIDPAHARKPVPPKPEQAPSPFGLRSALTQIGAAMMPGGLAAQSVNVRTAPAVYTVAAGDTVSAVAQQFGLSTASVLALNGLSWKSSIFPGQVLALTNAPMKTTGDPAPITRAGQYRIVKGDTISSLATHFGVSTQAVLDANELTWESIVYPGQTIAIPGRVPEATPVPAPIVGTAHDAPAPHPITTFTLAGDTESGGGAAPVAAANAGTGPTGAAAVANMPIAEQPVFPVAPSRSETPARSEAVRAPGAGPSPSSPNGPPPGGGVTPLSAEMRAHASTIVRVGRELGVPEYGIVIALATAMQESSLRNLSWGDRDSVGLFQQRPSSGWGTAADLQNPSHAATLFYVGRSGYTRGLLDIRGWQSMALTRAAQAVQISGHPTLYAKWETSAWAWYRELT